MQQRFLLQILLLAQHVSGTTMPIIRSSRVLYSGCCLWYLVLWFSSCWSGVEMRVVCPVCRMLVTASCKLESHSTKYHRQQPLYKTLELLMMGIVVMCPVCRMLVYQHPANRTHNLCSTPDQQLENHSTKHHRQQPLYNILELLMMGIVVPETCWASNKICNKNLWCI